MYCSCVQLANLHNDGKQTSASEAVFQRALKMTYESLVTSDRKVLSSVLSHSQLMSCRRCVYRVFQKKSTPPRKIFGNIFTLVKSFCMKFCRFVVNLYPHICTNFCRFILIYHKMALIFPRVAIVFTLSSFE